MGQQIGPTIRDILAAAATAVVMLLGITLVYILPYVSDFEPLLTGLADLSIATVSTIFGALVASIGLNTYRRKWQRNRTDRQADVPLASDAEPPNPLAAAPISPSSVECMAGVRAFLSGINLDSVVAIDLMAITGELQVRPICEWLEEARSLRERKLPVRILLRADSSSDSHRIRKREATREALERVKQAMPSLEYEIRHYSSLSPLRGIILEHRDGRFSAFLSFYTWQAQARMSGRELEVSWCYIRDYVSEDDKLLSVYRSWFAQFWGTHQLHTLLFDFDDTLFQTMDIQVRAWMHGLCTVVKSGLIEKGMITPDVQRVLGDERALHHAITRMLLHEQHEENMISRLFPDPLNEERLDALRAIRVKIRNSSTTQHAIPFHAITQYLPQLHREYQLVIVSATSEQPIKDVLKAHGLPFFSYIFGKEALHGWQDIEGKTPTFVRASNMLGVPLERMAFIGDSEADFRAARQLGLKFIESRLNARNFGQESLIRSRAPEDDAFIVDSDARNTLPAAIEQVRSALRTADHVKPALR